MPEIDPPKQGDPVSADLMAKIVAELERLGKWSAEAPLELTVSAGGFAIAYVGTDAGGDTSAGTEQYQLRTMVTANRAGWQDLEAHP